MKQLQHLLLIFISAITTVYLQSCYDPNSNVECNDTETQTRNITADDLSKVPYTGFDTLYFLNKQGDTCIVRGTGKQYSYETALVRANPACPPIAKHLNQLYEMRFIPVKGNLEFTLTQKSSPKAIYIDRPPYNVISICESATIDFRSLTDRYYIDSITINNMSYSRISLFLTEIRDEIEVRDTFNKLLYNKLYGVLYIKSAKENEEFSIIPKP